MWDIRKLTEYFLGVFAMNEIAPMSEIALVKVRILEEGALKLPQIPIVTSHVLHGGIYARTIMIPAGVLLTGALIKIATVLIVSGDVLVYIGGKTIELNGYNVIPAAANRKQAFVAKTDTHLTMLFPTDATSVEDAEKEFTDEVDMLITRKNKEA